MNEGLRLRTPARDRALRFLGYRVGRKNFGAWTVDSDDEQQVDLEPCMMNEVRPGLWVGDLASATSEAYLSAAGITHVVNATRMQVPHPGRRTVVQVPVDDTEREPLLLFFGRISQLIHQVLQDGNSILLHCQAGVSRSASVCAPLTRHAMPAADPQTSSQLPTSWLQNILIRTLRSLKFANEGCRLTPTKDSCASMFLPRSLVPRARDF